MQISIIRRIEIKLQVEFFLLVLLLLFMYTKENRIPFKSITDRTKKYRVPLNPVTDPTKKYAWDRAEIEKTAEEISPPPKKSKYLVKM